MRKLALKVLIFCMTICSALCVFTACGNVEFKINFVVDGEIYAVVDTNGAETLKMPENPVKDGYTFDGWFWDKDVWEKPFTANSLLDAPLSSDMSVYAKFTKNHEHNYIATITPPTCMERGYTTYTCDCGDSYIDDYTDVLGHTPDTAVEENRIEPKCEVKGGYDLVVYCKTCGAELSREHKEIAALSHEFGEWIETIAPTCAKKGVETRYCSHDNTHIETREINALGHTPDTAVEKNRIEPKCEVKGGYDLVVYCKTCGAELSREHKEIAALQHEFTNYVSDNNATYDSDGTKTAYCNHGCGETHTVIDEGSKLKKYTITFYDEDKVTILGKATVGCGTNAVYTNDTPVKNQDNGYTYIFDKWLKADNTTDDLTNVIDDRKVYASYTATPRVYNVYYIENGGTEINDATYTYSVGLSVLPDENDISKTGYTFESWKDAQCNAITAISTETYGDITLYAKWTAIHYDIAYVVNGGINGANPTQYTTEQTVELKDATKTGYTFAGWYNGDTKISSITQGSFGNLVLTAKWEINKYTVTFKNYDSSVLFVTTVDYGSPAIYDATTPQRADSDNKSYVFKGWDKEFNIIVDNIEVYAQYTVYDKYCFIYKNGSETFVKVLEGKTIESLMPSNTITTISGNIETSYSWNKKADYLYEEVKTTKNVYYVTYELYEGVNSSKNPNMVYENSTYELFDATKTGYTFIKWYIDSDKTIPVSELKNITNNVVLYADYSPISYGINYHLFGGNNAAKNPSTYTIEDEILLKDANKAGYTFNGWFTDAEMTKSILNISNKIGYLELYAKFTPNEFVATFNYSDCDYITPLIVTFDSNYYGGEKQMVEVGINDQINIYDYKPARSGYTFVGWCLDEECSNLITSDFNITSDIILYAKWSEYRSIVGAHFNVYYDEGTGTITGVLPVDCNVKIRVSASGDYNKSSSVYVRDLTNGARIIYKPDYYYTEQRYVNGKVQTVTVHRTSPDINYSYYMYKEDEGAYTYYYFRIPAGTIIELGGSGYSGAIEVNLASINTAKISLTNIQDKKVKYDEFINSPVLEKEGYIFDGWYDENSIKMSDLWNYLTDKSFTAKWEPITYKINYVLDGGENNIYNPIGYNIESNISLLSATKQGYTFEGWYLDENYNTKIESISNRIGNLTLYAKFSVNTYDLTLDADDGVFAPKIEFISENAVIRTEYLYEGQSIEKYYPSDREGYMFGGWYTDPDFAQIYNFDGKITDDLTLYAKWVETANNVLNIETIVSPVKVNIAGGKEIVYQFIPSCNATITVTSISNLDLIGTLYDSNKIVLISADDINDDNLNFSFTFNIYAGEIYYIAIKGNTVATSGSAEIDIIWNGNAKISGATYTDRTLSIVYGTEYCLPDFVEKEGYTFIGWYDENNIKYESGVWNYTENMNLHAVYEDKLC